MLESRVRDDAEVEFDSELEWEWLDELETECKSDADTEGLMVSAFDMKESLPAVAGVGGIVGGKDEYPALGVVSGEVGVSSTVKAS